MSMHEWSSLKKFCFGRCEKLQHYHWQHVCKFLLFLQIQSPTPKLGTVHTFNCESSRNGISVDKLAYMICRFAYHSPQIWQNKQWIFTTISSREQLSWIPSHACHLCPFQRSWFFLLYWKEHILTHCCHLNICKMHLILFSVIFIWIHDSLERRKQSLL